MPVLIVDDDDNILLALRLLLKSAGIECMTRNSPAEAMHAIREHSCELALVDLNYVEDTTSGREGLELIAALHAEDPELPIIAMTGWGTIGIAVQAMRRGAVDFIEKPWDDNDKLVRSMRCHLNARAQPSGAQRPSPDSSSQLQTEGRMLVCRSAAMQRLLAVAKRVAQSPMSVLITGENGTGKGLLAHYVHRHSARAAAPFVSVNMGGISEGTFESEMFGHTRGAFTDAKSERVGRIELAEQGTLFLDEIGNLPLTQQAKILRLLEERRYERLGSSQTQRADVRFIAATNADLDELIDTRGFRQDLLYRLNGVTLRIPSLRERPEDIYPLAEEFLGRARTHYRSPALRFSPKARCALERYGWPGNIRELQHVVERSVLLATNVCIEDEDLQIVDRRAPDAHEGAFKSMTLEQAEVWFVQQALNRHQGNANDAAKRLGISRSALYRRLGKRESLVSG